MVSRQWYAVWSEQPVVVYITALLLADQRQKAKLVVDDSEAKTSTCDWCMQPSQWKNEHCLATIGNLKLTALSSPTLFIFVGTVWILAARREESQNKTWSPIFQFSFDGDLTCQAVLNIRAEWWWFRPKEASSDISNGLKPFKPATSISFLVTAGHNVQQSASHLVTGICTIFISTYTEILRLSLYRNCTRMPPITQTYLPYEMLSRKKNLPYGTSEVTFISFGSYAFIWWNSGPQQVPYSKDRGGSFTEGITAGQHDWSVVPISCWG